MPTVSRFYGMKITVYFNELHSPHYHVWLNQQQIAVVYIGASWNLMEALLVAGSLQPLDKKQVKALRRWHADRQEDLLKAWDQSRTGNPDSIPPPAGSSP